MFGLDPWLTTLLISCIVAACAFEFINGFHDTANAVATVIYTNSLKPTVAVIWSGLWNFLGVYVGGIAVAIGIINLLPTEILVDQNIYHSVAMILALVLTAIIWNLGTWYFGIPCSSSHTLIGSIFGVGISFMLMPGNRDVVLNWHKVEDIGLSLLISPFIGFGLALFLMIVLKKALKDKRLFEEPPLNAPPPWWVRLVLIITCTSVSFSHGSNDGQKGVGLLMIILISIVPIHFAIDHSRKPAELSADLQRIEYSMQKIHNSLTDEVDIAYYNKISKMVDDIQDKIKDKEHFNQLEKESHFTIRKDMLQISKKYNTYLDDLNSEGKLHLSKEEIKGIKADIKKMSSYTQYAPWWVILMISSSLGLGTMIGWRRIVVTIGERIGKSHLTYAQGASAEIIAASTIGISTFLGLPVSTTHVLSSGIAGTMVAGKGLKNLRAKTVKNIAIAWLVTLPVTIIMSGTIFLALYYMIG